MAYEKTNWATGDVITAQKMNKIEAGIEGAAGNSPKVAVFYMQNDSENFRNVTCFTYNDIAPLIHDGYVIFVRWTDQNNSTCYVITNLVLYNESGATMVSLSSLGASGGYDMHGDSADQPFSYGYD